MTLRKNLQTHGRRSTSVALSRWAIQKNGMTPQEAHRLLKGMIIKPAFPSMLVSGGETGADRAALDFALAHGLGQAGYCPNGRKAEDGPIPDFYQLEETPSADFRESMKLNVEMADATVIFHPTKHASQASALTLRHAQSVGKPYLICPHFPNVQLDADALSAFLSLQSPLVLNVAGSRESSQSGMHAHVKAVLTVAAAHMKTRAINGSLQPFQSPTQESAGSFSV